MIKKPSYSDYKEYLCKHCSMRLLSQEEKKEYIDVKYSNQELKEIINNTFEFADYLIFDEQWEESTIDKNKLYAIYEYDGDKSDVFEEGADWLYCVYLPDKTLTISEMFMEDLLGFDVLYTGYLVEHYNEKEDVGSVYDITKIEVHTSKEHFDFLRKEFLPFHEELLEQKRQTEREKILAKKQIDEQNGQPWLDLEF